MTTPATLDAWIVVAEHWTEDDHREGIHGVRLSEAAAKRLAAKVDASPQPEGETRRKARVLGPYALHPEESST